MTKKLLLIISVAMLLPVLVMAQKKKVAVVTFYVNKYVEPDGNLAGNAQLLGNIAALSKNSDFNLSGILENFHKTFFTDFLPEFPFEVADEQTIWANENYKNMRSFDTTSIFYYNCLLYKDYKYTDVSFIFKSDVKKLIEYFPEYDGFMFVFLSYKISPKVAFGGMGSAGVCAYVNIKLWNKEAEKVFNIYEGEYSKESVALVAGIPVIEVEKILPMCQSATDKILIELKKRLPKMVKKVDKKL